MAKRKNSSYEKSLGCASTATLAPLIGCLGLIVVTVVVIVAAAGSILGWLFGGGAPDGQASTDKPPNGEIKLWTPTPVPSSCFITPTAVAITVMPTALPPTQPGDPPGGPTSTASTQFLPTPTPCPTPENKFATPDPRWTPAPVGYGPRGSPFHSRYVFTQEYGCTDFPEFKDSDCNAATNGRRPWFHRGVDIVSLGDKTVYATIEGKVEFAGFAGDGFGIRVYIRSGEFLVIYPHLSQTYVAAGQQIAWGQALGVEGSTGYSTGSHLHYEIHINGAWVDSTPYLLRPAS